MFLCTAFLLSTDLVSMLRVLRMEIKTTYVSHWLLIIPHYVVRYTYFEF